MTAPASLLTHRPLPGSRQSPNLPVLLSELVFSSTLTSTSTCPRGATSASSPRNSISVKRACSAAASGALSFRPSRSAGTSTSTLTSASSRLSRAMSACSRTRSSCASAASNEPQRASISFARLGPTPGTPGMLSTSSPLNANTSGTSSGLTPSFSFTCSGPYRFSFHGSYTVTPSPTSWSRSLSEVAIVTLNPGPSNLRARVASTSSASTPETSKLAIPQARTISFTTGI